MFDLIPKSLKSSLFYKTEYKRVSRRKTILFLILISVMYSLLISPLNTYNGFKDFNSFKSEVLKIPSALQVNVNKGKLTANFSKPLVVSVNKTTFMVVDPINKYTNYETLKNYIVLKEKGVVFVTNDQISNEQYPDSFNLNTTSEGIIENIKSISNYDVVAILGLFYFFINTINMLTELILISIIFGSFNYFLSSFIQKSNLTYPQSIKRVVFISIYLAIGYAINAIIGTPNNYVPYIIFGLAYLVITSKQNRSIKN